LCQLWQSAGADGVGEKQWGVMVAAWAEAAATTATQQRASRITKRLMPAPPAA
jgi:hypothetical protein